MKKIITTFLMLMTVFAISCICVQAEDEIKVYVNDSQIVFDQAPIIVEDRTMVPIRAVCEALGADVYWDAENPSTVLVVKNDTKLWLEIDMAGMYVLSFADFDEFYAYANTIHLWGYKNKIETVTLDASPMIYNDRTLLPIRAVCEALGANVLWDAESKSVQIMHNIEFISDRNRDVEFF